MGSGMSSYRRRPRGFVLDPSKGMLPVLGLQVLLEYGRAGSARPPATAALLAVNVLIFLRPGALDAILPKKAYVALNPNIFFKVRTHLCQAQLHGRILCTYRFFSLLENCATGIIIHNPTISLLGLL
jgi:hypothetical protein